MMVGSIFGAAAAGCFFFRKSNCIYVVKSSRCICKTVWSLSRLGRRRRWHLLLQTFQTQSNQHMRQSSSNQAMRVHV